MGEENLLPTEGSGGVNIEEFAGMKFDFTPDTSQGKVVITAFGGKNSGKTTGLLLVATGRLGGFRSGKTLVISFDDKSKTTVDQFFKGENIVVHDGTKYYSEDPLTKTKSGFMSYVYLQNLIKHEAKNNYDWIFFDGLTVESEILEMAMRYINGLKPTQGFANRNLWKDRGSMLRTLHALAVKTAGIGVMYSTYSEKDEIIKDGETVTKEDIPKYIDVVMLKTDVLLKASKANGKNGHVFLLKVDGTKFKQYYDHGQVLPITDRTLKEGVIFDVTGMSEQKKPSSALVEIPKADEKVTIHEVMKAKEVPVLQAATVTAAPKVEAVPVQQVKTEKPAEIKIVNQKQEIPSLLL